jgi:hypothetical protein
MSDSVDVRAFYDNLAEDIDKRHETLRDPRGMICGRSVTRVVDRQGRLWSALEIR